MTHDYYNRGKKDAGTFKDALKIIEDNLLKSISGLRDDIKYKRRHYLTIARR